MDRFRFAKLLLPFSWLVATASHAVTFNELERWQLDRNYRIGEVVAQGYDAYVATLPSHSLDPSKSKLAWQRVRYDRQRSFRLKRLYLPAQIVSHNDAFYLARRLTVARTSSDLQNPRRWLPFSHPGLLYDLPEYDEGDPALGTLTGIDGNRNGVRDDFEMSVLYSDLPSVVIDHAFAAGRVYGRLIASGSQTLDADARRKLFGDLVLSEECRREMALLHGGRTWEKATYFNDLQRIEASYKLENALLDVVDLNAFDLPQGDPCQRLSVNP